jgi:malonyl CoA-acyl carrier protein transacylase
LKTIFAFDGQGAFKPGFGKNLVESEFKSHFNRVIKYTKVDVEEYSWGKSAIKTTQDNSKLQITLFSQCYALGQATVTALLTPPDLVMGHSLGEISALIFCGALELQQGCDLIKKRGELMERVAKDLNQDLLIVQGVALPTLEEWVKLDSGLHIYISNINSKNQIAIAGATEDLKVFTQKLKNEKVKFLFLDARIGFHSPLLRGIADEFSEAIDSLTVLSPKIPFFSVQADRILEDADEIRSYLKSHLLAPVYWSRAMKTVTGMFNSDCRVIEIGPSKTLKGFFMTDCPGVPTHLCIEFVK